MADYEQALKLKMWKDTNYGGMLAEAEKVGVSKAAAIGGSGTGTQGASVGNVGGGNAADAASTTNARTAQAQAKGEKARPVVKAGAKKRQDGNVATRKKAQSRLQKTGSIDDALSLILNQ